MSTALRDRIVQHQPMLAAYVRALMHGDSHSADDVVQETILTALKRQADFQENRDSGRWLRGIARLKVMETWRHNQRFRVVEEPDVLSGIEETFCLFDRFGSEGTWIDEARERLEFCLQKLNDSLRGIVDHVYSRGVGLREAAVATGISEDAAAQRLSRARELLRLCVHRHRESDDVV